MPPCWCSLQAHAQVVQQVQALRMEHARQVADMESKLGWYAENYELLKGNEDLLRQQARTIVQLEQQLLLSPQRLGSSWEAVGRLADLEEENDKLKVGSQLLRKMRLAVGLVS